MKTRLLPLLATLLAGCAPISSFRPASSVADERGGEVGLGGSLVSPRPYVEEDTRAAGQLWLSKRVAQDLVLTGVGAVETHAFAVGGAMRADVVRTRVLVVAPEVELGVLWGAVNGGVALRIWKDSAIYAAPRFGSRGSTWGFDVPVGVSAYLYDGFVLRAELRAMWSGEITYYQQRRVLGLALVRQF